MLLESDCTQLCKYIHMAHSPPPAWARPPIRDRIGADQGLHAGHRYLSPPRAAPRPAHNVPKPLRLGPATLLADAGAPTVCSGRHLEHLGWCHTCTCSGSEYEYIIAPSPYPAPFGQKLSSKTCSQRSHFHTEVVKSANLHLSNVRIESAPAPPSPMEEELAVARVWQAAH